VDPDKYWVPLTTMKKNLEKLRERGMLPDPQIYEWVATEGEAHPTPDTHQVAIFIAHLLSNAIALLSIFAFLCEA